MNAPLASAALRDPLAHYTAQARRPTNPAQLAAWLATVPVNSLLPEAQYIARELATLKGHGHKPQRGCAFSTRFLGDAEVLVEYEYEPGDPGRLSGPPEDCYPPEPAQVTVLQVFINGVWCDPEDFIADAILERWHEEIEGEIDSAAEGERQDYEDDRAADLAADRYEREIDGRHA